MKFPSVGWLNIFSTLKFNGLMGGGIPKRE